MKLKDQIKVSNFNIDTVSWSEFKSTVDKKIASQFFNFRMWDKKAIINELLESYNQLEADIKAEIPLKRKWILTGTEV
ncbi:hypothetical protein [Cohnella abietis]|uniref:Uncharacterized protein n=1 Tax=Cohnella abietis TaxID=2507935 RepID=A0A3T1D4H9_9BACL|nr:hypothetical protein [Cohnella abietis]BBI32919.1 hypothetical protein KCTCHS21_23180 [Cohnella abietis]